MWKFLARLFKKETWKDKQYNVTLFRLNFFGMKRRNQNERISKDKNSFGGKEDIKRGDQGDQNNGRN